MREWMKGVPEQLLQHQERIDRAMGDYELIEEFYCNLSQDDFVAKYGWLSVWEPRFVLLYVLPRDIHVGIIDGSLF